MKKENGLKRTWQHFTKRASTLILAGAVAISILPMAVSAADETGGSSVISNGKAWELLSQVTMDDYESVEGSSGGISWWGGKKSDNTGWLSANAGSGKYAEFKTNLGYQRIHQGTGIRPISGEGGVTAPAIPGAGAITNVFKLNRAWSQQSGSWTAGMGKGAPDSYINISGLFDKTKVQVGDTVKITAWVMGLEMHDATTAADSMKPDDPATVTMWLADRARSGDVATNGPAADYNVSVPSLPGETASYDDMKQGEWKEISLTYEVTADNKDVTGIGINSDKMGSDKVAAFPLYLYLAGVKVEKLTEAKGSYTIENGKKAEPLAQVTMDDYKEVEGSSGGISWWGGKKSDNTGWLSANAGSGKYAEFKTNLGYQRIHQGTGIRPISGEGGVTAPAIPGAGAITNVFKLNRAWSQQSGSWTAGMGKGAPDSYINISGLFDNTNVQIGDTVKITAWVLGLEMHDATTAADSMKPDDAATVTMWLSDKARSGDVATNGPAADYNLAKPANASETASYDDMKQGEWKEISLTYTVTEGNKDVTGIGLNSDKMGSDKVAAFPLYLYVAGVKAEKLVDDPTQTAGTVSGTITAQIDDAAGTKIVVAAYQGNELLGCDIVDADAATTKYSFSIADASGTDKVIAYIWKLDNANPVLAPIPLTAN